MDARRLRAYALIDLGALARNYRALRAAAGGRRVIAVVKADAYGHGARLVAGALAAEGCDAFAVMTLDEALELRDAGLRQPILMLGGLLEPGDADVALARDVTPVLCRTEPLAWLDAAAARAGKRAPFQLEVDTGMGRLGVAPAALGEFLARVAAARRLVLDGVFSHLAEADDAASPVTARQRALFADAVARVRGAGFAPAWVHLDNSAGCARGATPGSDAIRPGIALYGCDPTREGGFALEPVMSLFARVLHAKNVEPGTRIGYGGEFVAKEAARILTLGVGYADGLPRAAGGRIEIGFAGRRAPLVGRVSCDLATAALPPVGAAAAPEAEVGEPALVFGRSGALVIPVEELARAVGTISYEILVRIGPRVPRIAA